MVGPCLRAPGFTFGACSSTIETGIKGSLIAIRLVSVLASNLLVKLRLNAGISTLSLGGWFISSGQRRIIDGEFKFKF